MKPQMHLSKTLARKMTYMSSLTMMALAVAWSLMGPAPRVVAETFDQPVLHEGGILPLPYITSVVRSNQQVTVQWWDPFGGPFTLQQTPTLGTQSWSMVTQTYGTNFTLPATSDNQYFRVTTPAPLFAGAGVCLTCHTNFNPETAGWVNTHHATALETLKRIHQDHNSECLQCHTVGYGLPTGFTNETANANLAGVQCENCHGPAGDHARSPFFTKPPIVWEAAELCGGCHNGFHHPTYDDWSTSPHGAVVEDAINEGSNASRMKSCGACHSGAVRLAMLKSYKENLPLDGLLPTAEEAAVTAVTCVVCHNPHTPTGNDLQLRNPEESLEFFSYQTSVDFAAQYNPNINVCGQCHNQRGAKWDDTSRPPHHSPQYNILIGDGGYELGPLPPPQSYHRQVDEQCAHCHMHPEEPEEPSDEEPVYTGHGFRPRLDSCAPCHSESEAELFIAHVQTEITNRIAQVKDLLDTWATMKAPAGLTQYGTLAWEYTNEGQLSNPTGNPDLKGPSSSEQALIPDNIKQARFNLYLVEHDASFGVHNADYERYLLSVAEYLVNAELDQVE